MWTATFRRRLAAAMLTSVFSIALEQKIVPGTVSTGKFDGQHPCLVGAVAGGRILIHSPHGLGAISGAAGNSETEISFLNIGQSVLSTACGRLGPETKGDLLFVGTAGTLQAYDVYNNSDLFYKEISEGCNCIVVGVLGSYKQPMAIIGGDCSMYGFDRTGDDIFYNISGDKVTCMALVDEFTDNEQAAVEKQLVVGSEDFDVRVFRNDDIVFDMTETEVVNCLCALGPDKFAYSLSNGTVGVYYRKERAWRIKSKNHVTALLAFDANGDGVVELITGWSNGKIDIRLAETGEVLHKDSLSTGVAGIVAADYKMDGRPLLLVVTVDGELKGYSPAYLAPTGGAPSVDIVDTSMEQDVIRELCQRKQNLTLELRNFEQNRKTAETLMQQAAENQKVSIDTSTVGVIPANTQFKTTLTVTMAPESDSAAPADGKGVYPRLELIATTSNETIIRAVLVFAEGIFVGGESYVAHPPPERLGRELAVPLWPIKDSSIDLHIKALIGFPESRQFHVFELTRTMPKFAMYYPLNEPLETKPKSYVLLTVSERVQRMVLWLNNNFLEQYDLNSGPLNIHMRSLRRPEETCVLEMKTNGSIAIFTDNIELAGDLVQSICAYFNLSDLDSQSSFPDVEQQMKSTMTEVIDFDRTRQEHTNQIADDSAQIKGLIVKAEDARLMGDFKSLRKAYMELMTSNRGLVSTYNQRSVNHNKLLSSLRRINQIIQKAARLKVGKFQTELVANCRQAVKNKDAESMSKCLFVPAAS